MTGRPAARFAPLLLACLLLAGAGAWTLFLRSDRRETCRDPEALARALALPSVAHSPGEGDGGLFDRRARELALPGPSKTMHVRSMRADPPYAVFRNWSEKIGPNMDSADVTARVLVVDGESIPIQEARHTVARASYLILALFVYDGRPIDSLLPEQIADVPEQLVHGSRPLTLYAADGWTGIESEDALRSAAEAWLAEAWRQHRSACR